MIKDNTKDRPIGRELVFSRGKQMSAPQARKNRFGLCKTGNFLVKNFDFWRGGGWGGGGSPRTKKNRTVVSTFEKKQYPMIVLLRDTLVSLESYTVMVKFH